MCNCIICNKFLHKPDFNKFCRVCYRSLMLLIGVSNNDFITYINKSFNINLTLNNSNYSCKFRDIYNVLKLKYTTLKNLDQILECILYIKIISIDYNILNILKQTKPKHRKYIPYIY